MQLKVVPLSGFTQGVQPIISYNYGAKQYQRVRLAIKRMAMVTIRPLLSSAFGHVAADRVRFPVYR